MLIYICLTATASHRLASQVWGSGESTEGDSVCYGCTRCRLRKFNYFPPVSPSKSRNRSWAPKAWDVFALLTTGLELYIYIYIYIYIYRYMHYNYICGGIGNVCLAPQSECALRREYRRPLPLVDVHGLRDT